MFNKVMLTFATRVLTAVLSVINVLIGTNYLGVEGYGTISLIILGITIYLMIQNLITGPSIIYYISRFKPSSILILSYAWALFSIFVFTAFVFSVEAITHEFKWSFEIVPSQYKLHNILLASGYGLMSIHLNLLLGRERIKAYNFIFLFQHLLASILLVTFYIILGKDELFYYLIALYISYFSSFLLAFIFSINYIVEFKFPSLDEFKRMLHYGALGQSANVFQLINYRLSYYLIDAFVGRASLGLFSAATQISEGLWIFGKSIATVQFAHISNSKDIEYARKLSLKLLKFTTSITTLPLIILAFLPVSFYNFLLGEGFDGVRLVIRWLAIGTLSLSSSMALSNYFSGIGRIGQNTKASGIGVLITLILGFSLIPSLGLIGAAITSSLSYLISFIFLIYHFNKDIRLNWRYWLLSASDIRDSWALLTSKISRKTK